MFWVFFVVVSSFVCVIPHPLFPVFLACEPGIHFQKHAEETKLRASAKIKGARVGVWAILYFPVPPPSFLAHPLPTSPQFFCLAQARSFAYTLVRSVRLGRVVRKPINVNSGLNVNWSITFSYWKMFFTSTFWCSLRLLQLKTEGQTI